MELNPGLRRGRQALPPLHQSFSLDRNARIRMRGKKASKKIEGHDVQGKMVPLFTAHHRQKKWEASTKTFPLWCVYLYRVEQPLFSSLPLTAAPLLFSLFNCWPISKILTRVYHGKNLNTLGNDWYTWQKQTYYRTLIVSIFWHGWVNLWDVRWSVRSWTASLITYGGIVCIILTSCCSSLVRGIHEARRIASKT